MRSVGTEFKKINISFKVKIIQQDYLEKNNVINQNKLKFKNF